MEIGSTGGRSDAGPVLILETSLPASGATGPIVFGGARHRWLPHWLFAEGGVT